MAKSFEENVCENANTLAHVGRHMMVLAHFKKEVVLARRLDPVCVSDVTCLSQVHLIESTRR